MRWLGWVGLAAFAGAACSSAGDPGDDLSGVIAFTVGRTASTPTADSVTVQIDPLDNGFLESVTAGAPFPVDEASVRIQVEILPVSDVASLQFTVRLLAGATTVFETQSRGSVRRGAETEVPAIEPSAWQEVTVSPGSGPSAREAGALAHAPALGGAVLYGGLTASGNSGATWVFDGTTWTELQLPGTPGPRHGHAMAFDSSRSEVVMFGGRLTNIAPEGDTWILGAGGWTEAQPATSPPARTAHAMAYDHSRRRVVLFGGMSLQGPLNDTWVWDGAVWQSTGPGAGPDARSGHTLVWSPLRRRVMLFGGNGVDGVRADVWEWDGAQWQPRSLPETVPGRREHAAGWDGGRGRMVVLGGVQVAGVPLEDVWELVDDRWMLVSHAVRPTARFGAAMVDAGPDGVVLFGGRDGAGFLNDLWRYR